jgi:hypothetical protein
MKFQYLILLLVFKTTTVFSQITNIQEHFSFGYGYRKNMSTTTLSYHGMFIYGKKQIIHAGFGFRLTAFSEPAKDFIGVTKNISDIKITPAAKVNINAINLPIYLEFHSKYLFVGGNIDLLGFSFGKKKDVLSVIGIKKPDSLFVKPTVINFFGRGTNNAEVYIGFKPKEEISIRLGLSLLKAEYHAQYRNAAKNNEFGRFYHQAMMPFISIVFNNDR